MTNKKPKKEKRGNTDDRTPTEQRGEVFTLPGHLQFTQQEGTLHPLTGPGEVHRELGEARRAAIHFD
jgi:hypothetical protein